MCRVTFKRKVLTQCRAIVFLLSRFFCWKFYIYIDGSLSNIKYKGYNECSKTKPAIVYQLPNRSEYRSVFQVIASEVIYLIAGRSFNRRSYIQSQVIHSITSHTFNHKSCNSIISHIFNHKSYIQSLAIYSIKL